MGGLIVEAGWAWGRGKKMEQEELKVGLTNILDRHRNLGRQYHWIRI